jgi:hypothetical protein
MILSTRADYVGDRRASLAMLRQAYKLAKVENDGPSLWMSAWSIAEWYAEEGTSKRWAWYWLQRMIEALEKWPDEVGTRQARSLRKRLAATG